MLTPLPRHDFYRAIHKGLRRANAQMLAELGAADWMNDHECERLRMTLARLVATGRQHLHHEDEFIRPLITAFAGEEATLIDADHDHHRAAFDGLSKLIDKLGAARPTSRPAIGHQLYLAFARHVGEDLAHMDMEETVVMPWLHAHYSDEELVAVEQAIIGSIAPHDFFDVIGLMVPALAPAERVGMLGDMREGAPAELFEAVMATVRDALDRRAFVRLQADLNLFAQAA